MFIEYNESVTKSYFSPEKKERLRFRIRVYIIVGIFALLLILAFGAIFRLPIFYFQDIAVAPGTRIATSTILALVHEEAVRHPLWRYISERSFLPWLFTPQALLGSATVIVTPEPHWMERRLVLRVTEPERYMIWC